MNTTTPEPRPPRDAVSVPATVGDGGVLPEYASPNAAGADLRASEAVEIAPGSRHAVATGLRLQLPPGHVVPVISSDESCEVPAQRLIEHMITLAGT